MVITGGSAMNRAKRNRLPRATQKQKESCALFCVISKIGEKRVDTLIQRWNSMEVNQHGQGGDGDLGDGILLCLMKLGLSHVDIRSFLKVGGYCCSRVYNISSNQEKVPTGANARFCRRRRRR